MPVTVHVGIGYDILHEHPNCDGAALGQTSYQDFLVFTAAIERLEGGVLLNFGSAVMGPEVYLKALAMARNVAHQEGRRIAKFTTAVFDLLPLDGDSRRQPRRPTRAITIGRGRRSWCAPSPTAARASTSRAITGRRCRRYTERRSRHVRAKTCSPPNVIDHILDRLPRLTIGVLGDLFLDRYLDIDAALTEPSIETGLDAYQVVSVRSYPGRRARSSTTSSPSASAASCRWRVIGDDGEGYELRQALGRHAGRGPDRRPDGSRAGERRRTPSRCSATPAGRRGS